MYAPLPRDQVNDALLRRLDGMPLSPEEALGYKTALLLHLGRRYAERG